MSQKPMPRLESRSSSASNPSIPRRLPVGPEVQPAGGVHFRCGEPPCQKVEVTFETASNTNGQAISGHELQPDGNGYFSVLVPGAAAGMLYRYRLDGEGPYPDPVSRFQPDGPHGPS